MISSKGGLRFLLKEGRLAMTDAEHTVKSRAIVERLKVEIDWSKIKTVHYFEPIRELLEVDTSDLITYLEDNYPSIQFFTPRLIDGVWEMISIKDKAPPDNFDIVIVPMLGFDPKTLHRIGYGGGYYDKFLATQPKAKKIGAGFETGKLDHVPVETHDIPLGIIITERQVYQR